jgi:hypothetical protein
VPTGRKHGVSISLCGVESTPDRAEEAASDARIAKRLMFTGVT